jgi:hypothetical protein
MSRKVSRKEINNRSNPNERSSLNKRVKIFTKLERKITTVDHEEFIKKSDVTLGDKKKLLVITLLNMLAFLG